MSFSNLFAWMLGRFETIIRRWLDSGRDTASPLYHDYIEGMLADYEEASKKWYKENQSGDLRAIIYLLCWVTQILWGVFCLSLHRIRRGLSLLFFAIEQHFALTQSATPPSLRGLIIRETFSWLHQVTDNMGIQADTVEVMLNSNAQIIGWSEGATAVFGFEADDVLGRAATECFIPTTETSGRSLADLIHNLCLAPDQYSLNLNKNRDQAGVRYWMIWANVPVYSPDGELIETRFRGIKIADPGLMQYLLLRWKIGKIFGCCRIL